MSDVGFVVDFVDVVLDFGNSFNEFGLVVNVGNFGGIFCSSIDDSDFVVFEDDIRFDGFV